MSLIDRIDGITWWIAIPFMRLTEDSPDKTLRVLGVVMTALCGIVTLPLAAPFFLLVSALEFWRSI